MTRTPLSLLLGCALGLGIVVAPATTAAPAPTTTNGCVSSVPELGTTEPVQICYSLFQPGGASASNRVPLVFHSHGWGGSRTTDAGSFSRYLDAGFGVLSFDQRGFGESGGKARVENPEFEGRDVAKLVALVAGLPWVVQDGPGDPRIGAIGGSYGGGYQFVGAFRHLMDRGTPVFDALAPEITWWDLSESLAPQGAVRTLWATALTAAGAPSLPAEVLRAFAYGAATGNWPDGDRPGEPDLSSFFEKNGPAWHAANGRRLNIPVLFGQGATDNLFPLDQGLKNFQGALTPQARARSIFVGYNGGHALPSALPGGIGVAADACSPKLGSASFGDLALRFLRLYLKGENTGLTGFGKYHLTTADGGCATVGSVQPTRKFHAGLIATPETGGAPVATKIASGPIRVAGTSYVDALVTAAGVNNRAFFALAVGRNRAVAKIVQNNVLPLNEPRPVVGVRRTIELPSVAVDVPAGEHLYLLVSPVSDMFAGMGSRTPGAIVLRKTLVKVPVVPQGSLR